MTKNLSDICIEARAAIGRGINGDAINGAILINILALNEKIDKLIAVIENKESGCNSTKKEEIKPEVQKKVATKEEKK